MKKNFRNKKIFLSAIMLFLFLVLSLFKFTFSQEVEKSLRVQEDTDLTYYLTISYDGKDTERVESNLDESNPTTANVKSGIIYVEDTIPEGLTFMGFVHAEGQTSFGSIMRNTEDSTLVCPGFIINDFVDGDNNTDPTIAYNYYGLHYDPATRKVSFQIRDMQAGCDLVIGIITHTPTLESSHDRKDFYNFATIREDALTVDSNTVHAWMGSENPDFYTVTYEYTGDVPETAPALSASNRNVSDPIEYAKDTHVGLRGDVLVKGYNFSGWTAKKPSGLPIYNNAFFMPSNDVILEGSFTKLDTYTVSYKINGEMPSGYEKPADKEYYPNELVSLDIMKPGDIFSGYVFQGWTAETPSDLVINPDANDFTMPEQNVVLIGEFKKITYKVEYQFTGDTMPPNADALLPDTENYEAGATVTLKDVKNQPTGYHFLGWYSKNSFTMPEENVIIYGEWREMKSTIRPTITKEIIDKKEEYREGDTVKYKITVNNTALYPIKDVSVVENNQNAYFIDGTGYTVTSTHLVTIPTINANSSIIVYAEYKVTENDIGIIENTVEIVSVTTDKNDELDPDEDYTDKEEFKKADQSKLKICKNVDNLENNKDFTFTIVGDNKYQLGIRLSNGECKNMTIDSGSYTVTEIIPQEYEIKNVEGAITSNGGKFEAEPGKSYTIVFTNTFKRKGFYHSSGEVPNIVRSKKGTSDIAFVNLDDLRMKKLNVYQNLFSTRMLWLRYR